MLDDIRSRLGIVDPSSFERLCCELLAREFEEYRGIEPTYNRTGKTTRGTPDAYVALEGGTYICFQFTTQQTGVETKVLRDIDDLDTDKCRFKGKVSKAVICVNTPIRGEREAYRSRCESHGWEHDFFSLERLSQLLQNYHDLCLTYLKLNIPPASPAVGKAEILFDCGARLKEVRDELQLEASRAVELLGYHSQKQYTRIEREEDEGSLGLVERFSDLTGASVEWLKHGKGPKYLTGSLQYSDPAAAIRQLDEWGARKLYLMLEERHLWLSAVAELSDYRWLFVHFNVNLMLWTWSGDYEKIPAVYDFLKILQTNYDRRITGRLIPPEEFQSLISGEMHGKRAIRGGHIQEQHWPEDILDIRHRFPISERYGSIYGDWFLKIQESFRKKNADRIEKTPR